MNNDLISREALKKAIKEKFGVYLDGTLNNRLLFGLIDNAPTVDLWEMRQEATENALKKAEVLYARPQGERAERALAIIDRLRTDGHINNREQGTLRRAILLPERPQNEITNEDIQQAIKEGFANGYEMAKVKFEPKKGKWIDTGSGQECNVCHEIQYGYDNFRHFCANCGADMRGGAV